MDPPTAGLSHNERVKECVVVVLLQEIIPRLCKHFQSEFELFSEDDSENLLVSIFPHESRERLYREMDVNTAVGWHRTRLAINSRGNTLFE